MTATNKNIKTAVLSLEFCSLYVGTAKLSEMCFIETDVQHIALKETPMACNEEEAVGPIAVREQLPQI